tara:strand:- start:153 stop:392 length:240 start_codon:yes stop_codon:yes gene_type:complete
MSKALGQQFHDQLITQFIDKRHEIGYTQIDMDEILGVAKGLVSKWEAGIRKPSGFLFCCWADALECELKLEKKENQKSK